MAYGLGDSLKAFGTPSRWSKIGIGSVFGYNSEVNDKTNNWEDKLGSGLAGLGNVAATFFSGGTVSATRLAAAASRASLVRTFVTSLGGLPVIRHAVIGVNGLGTLGMRGARWLQTKIPQTVKTKASAARGWLSRNFNFSKVPVPIMDKMLIWGLGFAYEIKLFAKSFKLPVASVDLLVDAAIRTDATTRANLMLSLNEPIQAAKIAEILNNQIMLPEGKIAEVLQFAQEKSLDRSHVYTVKQNLQDSFYSIKQSFREQDENFHLESLVGDKVALLQKHREFALEKLDLNIEQLAKYFKATLPQEVDVFELIVLKAAQVLSKNTKFRINGRDGLKSKIFTMLDSLNITDDPQAQQITHLKRFFQTGYRGRINATQLADLLDGPEKSSSSGEARTKTQRSKSTTSGPKRRRRKRRKLRFR